jgi:hypothetical protein
MIIVIIAFYLFFMVNLQAQKTVITLKPKPNDLPPIVIDNI